LDALDALYPDARTELRHENPFQLLVATMLSAQTTDRLVNEVTPALFAAFPTPEAMAAAGAEGIAPYIRRLGLYRSKARHLAATCQALVERHGGEVPRTREALEALPGVGRKTANVVLSNAFGVPAIAVDTHVFRVARRLGLAAGRTPGEVEAELERLAPPERWIRLHHQLIWHGRRLCRAQRPACAACALRPLCPEGLRRLEPTEA